MGKRSKDEFNLRGEIGGTALGDAAGGRATEGMGTTMDRFSLSRCFNGGEIGGTALGDGENGGTALGDAAGGRATEGMGTTMDRFSLSRCFNAVEEPEPERSAQR